MSSYFICHFVFLFHIYHIVFRIFIFTFSIIFCVGPKAQVLSPFLQAQFSPYCNPNPKPNSRPILPSLQAQSCKITQLDMAQTKQAGLGFNSRAHHYHPMAKHPVTFLFRARPQPSCCFPSPTLQCTALSPLHAARASGLHVLALPCHAPANAPSREDSSLEQPLLV